MECSPATDNVEHRIFYGAYGAWFGATDKYMGLRLKISAAQHYGWARFDVSEDGITLTAKDYAYESTAATSIPAGNTGEVGIANIDQAE
jgi:hypothetical protein